MDCRGIKMIVIPSGFRKGFYPYLETNYDKKLTFTEVIRQEYSGNNCIISSGFVTGAGKPTQDTMYLQLEKDVPGQGHVITTQLHLRPDEMAAIAWCATGCLWSDSMNKKQ